MRKAKIIRSFLCFALFSAIALGYYFIINASSYGGLKSWYLGCAAIWLMIFFTIFSILAIDYLFMTILRILIAFMNKDEHPSNDPSELAYFRFASFLTLFCSYPALMLICGDELEALIYFILFAIATIATLILSFIIPFVIRRKARR